MATVHVDHSAYSLPTSSACELVPGAGNVATTGVQFAPDQVTQLAASATVDKGLSDAYTGSRDSEGDPRPMGDAVDIGADELRALPTAISGGATDATPTGVTLTGTVDGRGAPVSYRFQYGETEAYGGVTPATPASGAAVSAAVTGLQPHTTYHFRVVATNAFGGETLGQDRTFTTPHPDPTPPGDSPTDTPGGTADGPGLRPTTDQGAAADRTAPACRGLKLKRRKGRTVLSGRCDEAATLTLVMRESGRRRARTRRVSVATARFSLRIGGRRVTRAVVTAKDAAGNAAAPRTLRRR
jgi:hypothetical protein